MPIIKNSEAHHRPILQLGSDDVYRQIKRWSARERAWGMLMLVVVVIMQPVRWFLFEVAINVPLIPVYGLLTLFGLVLCFYEKEISISKASDYVCFRYKLLVTYSISKHKLSDFFNVRVRDYWVKGDTRAISGVTGTTYSRVSLTKKNLERGR